MTATRYDKAPCENRRLRYSKFFNGKNRENLSLTQLKVSTAFSQKEKS